MLKTVLGVMTAAIPTELRQFTAAISDFFDRARAVPLVSIGAEAANVRRFTITVTDRLKRPATGRWEVHLWLATAAYGTASGVQTVTFIKGTVLRTISANQDWIVETDGDGVIQLDVDAGGGAQTRFLHVTDPLEILATSAGWT